MASFGENNPAMAAIKNAIDRRQQGGGGTPALDQQSAVSATPAPLPANPTSGVAPVGGGGTQAPVSESELIVKALNSRLSSISAVEKAQNVPQTA